MKAQWENEKNAINKVQSLRAEVESHQGRNREGHPQRRLRPRPASCNTASCLPCKKQLEEEEKIAEDEEGVEPAA